MQVNKERKRKGKLLLMILVCLSLFAGIGIFWHLKKPAAPVLCSVEIPTFPIVANTNSAEDTPSQVPGSVEMESTGEITAYTIHGNFIYYIVAYDFGGFGWTKQFSVFKQSLAGGELKKVTDYVCERPIDVTELRFDEYLQWIGYDEAYEYFRYTLLDDHVEEASYEEKQAPNMEDIISGFHVDEEALKGELFLCGEDDDYIVWMQEPYSREGVQSSYSERWNVLDKKRDKVSTYMVEEYGQTVYLPIFCKGNLFFLAHGDIGEEGSADNIFRLNLATGAVERLTSSYSEEDAESRIDYDFPQVYDNGVCFISRLYKNGEYYYEYMYYTR